MKLAAGGDKRKMTRKFGIVKSDGTINRPTDADSFEESPSVDEKQNRSRGREGSFKSFAMILVLIIALGAVAAVIILGQGRTYESAKELASVSLRGAGEVSGFAYGKGFLYVTKDGAEAIDDTGKPLWNVTYDMKSPRAAVCGKCAAIGDKGNRRLYICDGTGSVNGIDVIYPIVDVAVSENAIAAVWTNAALEDHIYIYDIEGTMLLDVCTTATGNGFPFAMALSPDGRKLATSYVDVSGTKTVSDLTFYNFGGVGQSYVDKIVGSYTYEKTILPYITFANNNTVAVCLESGADIYSFKELPELTSRIYPEGNIKSLFFDGDEAVGFVLEKQSDDNELSEKEPTEPDIDSDPADTARSGQASDPADAARSGQASDPADAARSGQASDPADAAQSGQASDSADAATTREDSSEKGIYKNRTMEVETYSFSGSKKGSFDLNESYTGIAAAAGSIYIYNNTSLKIYSTGGNLKYSGSLSQGIRAILPITSTRFAAQEDTAVALYELY